LVEKGMDFGRRRRRRRRRRRQRQMCTAIQEKRGNF
jgi:hypothetical protein